MKKRAKKRRPTASDVRNINEYFSLPDTEQLRREKGLRALWLMRNRRMSLAAAAKEVGVTPRFVQKIAGGSLRKVRARYKPSKGDNLLRIMVLPAEGGRVELEIRGSRNASAVSAYDRAVHRYLYTGDASALEPFFGQFINCRGQRFPLLTDKRALDRLSRAHAISFESIYARTV